jgi:hypothetical protein
MSEDVKVGDVVKVCTRWAGNRLEWRDATVIEAARVWITLKADVGGREWRMRRDTRNGDTGYGYGGDFFRTVQEYEDGVLAGEARTFLQARGIVVGQGDFSSDAAVVRLANAVKELVA